MQCLCNAHSPQTRSTRFLQRYIHCYLPEPVAKCTMGECVKDSLDFGYSLHSIRRVEPPTDKSLSCRRGYPLTVWPHRAGPRPAEKAPEVRHLGSSFRGRLASFRSSPTGLVRGLYRLRADCGSQSTLPKWAPKVMRPGPEKPAGPWPSTRNHPESKG